MKPIILFLVIEGGQTPGITAVKTAHPAIENTHYNSGCGLLAEKKVSGTHIDRQIILRALGEKTLVS